MEKSDEFFRKIENNACYTDFFLQAPFPAFLVLSDTGRVVHVNTIFEAETGFSEEEVRLIGKSQLFFSEMEGEELRRRIKERERFDDLKLTLRTKVGKDRLYLISGRHFAIEGEEVMLCFMKDITDQVRLFKNLEHHLAMEKIILSFASQYINLPLEKADEMLKKALIKLAVFFDADRAYIFTYDSEKKKINNTFEWCARGITPVMAPIQDYPVERINHWVERHKAGEVLAIPDVSKLKDDVFKTMLQPYHIRSNLTAPILNGRDCLGFIGFDSIRKRHRYTGKEIKLLRLFASIQENIEIRKDLVAAEKEAKILSHAKSEFLSNLSHEIRTPISGITSVLETMMDMVEKDDVRDLIHMAHQSAVQLETIFNDLYDIVRLSKEASAPVEEAVRVREMTTEIFDLFKISAKEKNLSFEIKAFDEPEVILSDRKRLKQIISKLLDNAIKFTFQGEVSVTLWYKALNTQNGILEIAVSDTGIGMDELTREKIFEIFYQKDLSLTKEFKGLGLGLPRVSAIVKKMKGSISLTSLQDAGSTFTCLIPVKNG